MVKRDPAVPDWLGETALRAAWRQVRKKAGGPGIDGVTIARFGGRLDAEIKRAQQQILNQHYQPQPLLACSIAKPDGGERVLRIPTVRDRWLQTSVAKELMRVLDPGMAPTSFAYRSGLSVEHAIGRLVTFQLWGYRWVLDADIETFFDSVPHGRLKAMLAEKSGCTMADRLIDQWLRGFRLEGRGSSRRPVGLAQGSPISPLLANLYLDPLDRGLNRKGMRMVRYADDFIVLVRTASGLARAERRAGEILRGLDLRLNARKTRRASFADGFAFLGHHFMGQKVSKA